MARDDADERLRSIKHIVVLMMENRSFDHMLGYLGLPGGIAGVDGLQNAQANFDAQGSAHPPFELGRDRTAFRRPGEPYDQSLDPCHGPECVAEQLAEFHGVKPGGFVKNFVSEKNPPADWRALPMGYYTDQCLPVYDFLARQFCVCDAWHSSIPGDTWPNRLYSLAGQVGPKVHFDLLERLVARITGKKPSVPIYEVEAFTRQLRDEQWRWYSHDPATLRAADKLYRSFDRRRENFAYFNRKRVSDLTQALEAPIVAHDSFLDDAAKHQLRDVSWIDPNFIDLHVFDPVSDDDHPPSDVLAGQALVLELYHALTKTSDWQDTLLVVCYDEHGGFYDHVAPPAVSDNSGHKTLGVRVPALVVGPRVGKQVCHETLEHTSLIKTILQRFASNPEHAIRAMPERVQRAPHLGMLLEAEPRTDLEPRTQLHEEMSSWRQAARRERRAGDGAPSSSFDGAGHPLDLHDFQKEFVEFALAMRDQGLPPGQP
jgi:phospholipase C